MQVEIISKIKRKSIITIRLWAFLFNYYIFKTFQKIKILGYPKKHKEKQLIKVAILIDEFFGAWETAFGGYGFLARNIICKHLPDKKESIDIEVILHGNSVDGPPMEKKIDNIKVYKPSNNVKILKKWLEQKNYDIFLSIELTHLDVIQHIPDPRKHVLWVQDPRPKSEWIEIKTVSMFPENCYYNQKIYDYVKIHQKNITFISQGKFLNPLARKLYKLKENIKIQYIPNPLPAKRQSSKCSKKNNSVIFLGRIESVKRGWIFCEIAKQMPDVKFYVIGSTFREKEKNKQVLSKYIDENGISKISNLYFLGHLEGIKKLNFIKQAKVLVNTSIHEALPISFLEALSEGTLIVSCRNPENLTKKYGVYVGKVLGNGFASTDKFVRAIRFILKNERWRKATAYKAKKYILNNHSMKTFKKEIKQVFNEIIKKTSYK